MKKLLLKYFYNSLDYINILQIATRTYLWNLDKTWGWCWDYAEKIVKGFKK